MPVGSSYAALPPPTPPSHPAPTNTQEFTSAGGPKTWETFTLSVPGFSRGSVELFAVEGPTFVRFPDYPTLRVVDFEMVGELITDGPGHFEVRGVFPAGVALLSSSNITARPTDHDRLYVHRPDPTPAVMSCLRTGPCTSCASSI